MKFGNNEFQLIEKGETELFHSALVQINDSTKVKNHQLLAKNYSHIINFMIE